MKTEGLKEVLDKVYKKTPSIFLLFTIYTIVIVLIIVILYDTILGLIFLAMSFSALWIFFIILEYNKENIKKDKTNDKESKEN